MKKPLSLLLLGTLSLMFCWVSSATTDTQLIYQLNSWSNNVSASSLKFTQAKSCESIQEMLKKYAKEQPSFIRWWWIIKSYNAITNDAMMMVEESADMADWELWISLTSSSTDYSTTNIQKVWVDEPEIIKTDGKYFYYYNSKTNKISIVASPLDIDSATLNPANVKILKEIAIPNGLYNIELFIQWDRLVLMGDYQATNRIDEYIFNGSRTILAVYDVSDITNLKLLILENLPWYY